jgi:AraC-like DNA-binding protein
MWYFALSSPRTRMLCERAMHCAALPSARCAEVGDVLTASDILLHDFREHFGASCDWLDALTESGRGPLVVAVLESPASPVLHALLQPERRFHCADIVLAAESTPLSLATALVEVSAHRGEQDVTAVLRSVWCDDAVLMAIARTAIRLTRRSLSDAPATQAMATWPTESQLLRIARVGRGTFVRHAHKAGFRPALRFLQVCRVLSVAHGLHLFRGSIEVSARRFGYPSTATLRRHFRTLTGMPPHEARHLSLRELGEVMRQRFAPTDEGHRAVRGVEQLSLLDAGLR